MCSSTVAFCIVFVCFWELQKQGCVEARRWKGKPKNTPVPPIPKDVRMIQNQRLIAFDLDGTLWPFKASDGQLPLKLNPRNEEEVVDKTGKKYTAFKNIANILKMLYRKKYFVAAISKDDDRTNAEAFLEEFQLSQYITHFEIYPGPSTKHIESLHVSTKTYFRNMLYFCKNEQDGENVKKLNVTTLCVDEKGLNMDALNKGLQLLYLSRHEFPFAEN
uniref:Uncharacterized protein n=1 Tax=Clastoptera arizonana TaxID=38151 RepID=A0A1B6D2T8_9HEMI